MTLGELFQSESIRAADWTCSERQMVCFEVMGWSLNEQVLFANQDLDLSMLRNIRAVAKRAQAGEPLSYIFGVVYFDELRLSVEPGVLIPRPDTEVLVEAAENWIAATQNPRLHDVCTGNGAVALALKARRPDAMVSGSDLIHVAVECARRNADDLNLEVSFSQSDLFEGLGQFDLVTANPPYIALGDSEIDASVSEHEPHSAIYAGYDGLEVMRRLLRDAKGHLKSGGALFVEHGYRQAKVVRTLALEHGWADIETILDLAGRDRVARMHKP